MATSVFTGYRTKTLGACSICGCEDEWTVDGRGNVLCSCQACPDCGMVDAYGFHESDCPEVKAENEFFDHEHFDEVA